MRAVASASAVAWCGLDPVETLHAQDHAPSPLNAPTEALIHRELPDDPWMPRFASPPPGTISHTGPWVRGTFESVQVNVDEFGSNILGDAANEPSIAVDPTNPDRIVIGWRQFDSVASNFRQAGYAYSHDAGQTWTFPGVLGPGIFGSDPVLGADADGNFYYYSLQPDRGPGDWACYLYKSGDGGLTWNTGVYAYGGDKPWMTIDQTSGPGRNNIYAYWTRYISCCNGQFTRSKDGGQTFGDLMGLPLSPQWGTLSVGPDGELYVAGAGFEVVRSTNARDPDVTPVFDFSALVDLGGNLIFRAGPNPGGLLGQAWIATDHSPGMNRGNVYLLASVDPPGSDPLDVMFARSTDWGMTWSAPIRVNDDPADNGAWQWFGTMSVAPNGRIDAIWNDTRNTGTAILSEVFHTFSIDGGVTWSKNTPVSPVFNSTVGWPDQNKIGDYYHMISDNGGANLAYAATFNGEQDIYFLRITRDCNDNGIFDEEDITGGTSGDCNGNLIPDECEEDCNNSGLPDDCDVAGGTSDDCNENQVPDDCEEDCNDTGLPDACDIAGGSSDDCNENQVPDECEEDCNDSGLPDDCDVTGGTSDDCNQNQVPDECEPLEDCNDNGVQDICDIAEGQSDDCDGDQQPDECETDCNANGVPDECDVTRPWPPAVNDCTRAHPACPGVTYFGSTKWATNDGSASCGASDASPDVWYRFESRVAGTLMLQLCESAYDTVVSVHTGCPGDVANELACDDDYCYPGSWVAARVEADTSYWIRVSGYSGAVGDFELTVYGVGDLSDCGPLSVDCNRNSIPDECEEDCNANRISDMCDIAGETSDDCDGNDIPDECDVASLDCNDTGLPDPCDIYQCGPPAGLCPGDGDCCSQGGNGTPGCDCARCCDAVCQVMPSCCQTMWDPSCAAMAFYSPECNCGGSGLEWSDDCNANGVPDECDIADEVIPDCNANDIPDDCEPDADDDGVIDVCDACPEDPGKSEPGECGCGVADMDTDDDFTADCVDPDDDNDGLLDTDDAAPLDPNLCEDSDRDTCDDCAIGVDGFGPLPDNDPADDGTDSDGDGACDAGDGCPDDPEKTEPGECGCGEAELDSDLDTRPDCIDQCPGEDDRIDEDESGVPDCLEQVVIPTVSKWGLVIMGLLLAIGMKIKFGRGRAAEV